MVAGEMDDDRVRTKFDRIEKVATLERERDIIELYNSGLAKAWRRFNDARYVSLAVPTTKD